MATITIQSPRRCMATGRCMATVVAALGLGVLGLGGLSVIVAPSVTVAAEPPPEWDGLLRVPDKGADHLYILRGANFAQYTRVRIDPVQIAFDEHWQPNAGKRDLQRRLSKNDLDDIRSNLAREFHDLFPEALTKGGYMLTDEDGYDVLRVTPQIVNLYIAAPSKPTSGRSRIYVANSGHMTLVLELRDSVTQQLLARVVDTAQGRRTGTFQVASSVTNLADARAALHKWSDVLLTALDHAKQSSHETAVATEAPLTPAAGPKAHSVPR